MTTLAIIAKEPLPGRVKTRLHPPLSLEQAANLAAAALADTLFVAAHVPATRRVLFYDGVVVPEGAAGFDVVAQPGGGLDERLAALFDQLVEPVALIGMDTPQVTAHLLAPLFSRWPDDVDAWFGPATDGGFWCLALAEPDGSLLRGVPMSRIDTGRVLLERLLGRGLRVAMLPMLTDVDTFDTALEVAMIAPFGRFAATLADITEERERHPGVDSVHSVVSASPSSSFAGATR